MSSKPQRFWVVKFPNGIPMAKTLRHDEFSAMVAAAKIVEVVWEKLKKAGYRCVQVELTEVGKKAVTA